MTENSKRSCPDCQATMRPIAIIDHNRDTKADAVDGFLTYTSPDQRPEFWSGSIAAEGSVNAFACTDCGRILLYARPSEIRLT